MMHTDTMTDICRRIISALIKGRNVHEYTLAASSDVTAILAGWDAISSTAFYPFKRLVV